MHRVAERADLTADQAREAMLDILGGGVSTTLIAAFLVALRMKGETAAELLGFARAMRERAARIDPGPGPVLDTCGTGGDGLSSFNISTVAAFVVAGAGARVAKHGNRSISSQCGSADLLEGLGVNIRMSPARAGEAIRQVGIGFLFAPDVHPAMKYAQPARLELKMRTVFNLLGPLTNPAGASAQLAGAPSEHAAGLMAQALACLGLKRGFVVHASDGMDEITTTGSTLALWVEDGKVTRMSVSPDDFRVPLAKPQDFAGGDRQKNCEIARAVLSGAKGPQRDIVAVNAAAALVASGHAAGFEEGMSMAGLSLDSGAAARKVEELSRFSLTP